MRAEVLDWAALGGSGARCYDVVLACDVLYEVQAASLCVCAQTKYSPPGHAEVCSAIDDVAQPVKPRYLEQRCQLHDDASTGVELRRQATLLTLIACSQGHQAGP